MAGYEGTNEIVNSLRLQQTFRLQRNDNFRGDVFRVLSFQEQHCNGYKRNPGYNRSRVNGRQTTLRNRTYKLNSDPDCSFSF